MTVTAERILELSELPCEEPGAVPPDGLGLGWLAVAFPVNYPREHPEAVECSATFGGGVALDFDVGAHSYALDVNLSERVGVLERIYPTAVGLGEYDLADDGSWQSIGQMMTADAGGNVAADSPEQGVSRHDPWRMLSDAVWSWHRMELNGWDDEDEFGDPGPHGAAVREWLRIAGESCGENYDHLYRELAARYPAAAAMVAQSAGLQHALMDIKSEQRRALADEWFFTSEDDDLDD